MKLYKQHTVEINMGFFVFFLSRNEGSANKYIWNVLNKIFYLIYIKINF